MSALKLELGCGARPTDGYVHHDRIAHAQYVDLAWDLTRTPWPFVPISDGDGTRVGIGDIVPPPDPALLRMADDARTTAHEHRYLEAMAASEVVPFKLTKPATKEDLVKISDFLAVSPSADVQVMPPMGYRAMNPLMSAMVRATHDGFLDEILALGVFEHVSPKVTDWLDECWRLLKPDGLLDLRLPAWDNENTYRDPTHTRAGFHQHTFHYWDTNPPEDGPDSLHRDFGCYYFATSEAQPYTKWWRVASVRRENGDFRYNLIKRA